MNQDQRAAFEAWHKKEMWASGYDEKIDDPDAYEIDDYGYYFDIKIQIAWRGYQAALQSQKPKTNDLMLSAVLRMPFDMAMANHFSRMQFYQRAQQALDELEALQSQDREDDPLQPAVNWLNATIIDLKATDIQRRLFVGHNRAQRMLAHARRVEGQQGEQKSNEPDLAQGKTMENITTVTPVDHNLADPTQADLADPMFEAIWQAIKEWDLSRNGGIGASYAGATGTDVMTILTPVRQTLVDWAVDQWRKQVESRPLNNMHRRSLDDVWRQVIRRMGADDVSLIGPTHDELLKGRK